MLRTVTLATLLSLASSTAALACSCMTNLGEQQLAAAMEKVEVRITLPVLHQLSINSETEFDDYTVTTTHRILDPLGLSATETLQTQSAPESGGNCGVTPAIGVVNVLNASRWKGDTLYTGSCGTVPAHMAALYQRDGLDRRIPSRLACTDLSELSGWRKKAMKRNGDDMSEVGSERTDPMCEFHMIEDDGPIVLDFKARLDQAKASAAEWVVSPALNERPGDASGDTSLVFGLPIRSELTPEGRRLTRVIILEDFGLGLERTVDMATFPDPEEPWSEIEVGVQQIFHVDALGALRMQGWDNEEDHTAALYKQLMGSALPETCIDDRLDNAETCGPLMEPFEARMMESLYEPIHEDELAAALAAE